MVAEIGSMIVRWADLEPCAECHYHHCLLYDFFQVHYSRHTSRNTAFCAIILVFGLMGILNISLDYITATLTGISIGVGTDYTAYFLWRLRERSCARGDLEKGYVDTMTSIGKGIVYNGFSVVVGFFVFFFSNFLPIRFFGLLVSFSILACIVSTLTILPVIIFMVKPKFLTESAAGATVHSDYFTGSLVQVQYAESKIADERGRYSYRVGIYRRIVMLIPSLICFE
ncbi:MAG: MMPL family transporter [Desulfobacterales bacterium]|nr:MMPL family transporter [Desulfobacterales bacterium]